MSILQLQPCQQSGEQTAILVSGDSLVLRPGFQNGSLMGSRDAPDWSKTEKKGQWVGCWGPVGATTAYSSTVCSKRKHCCLPHSCSPRLMDIFLCGLLGPGTIVIQTQKEKPSVQLSWHNSKLYPWFINMDSFLIRVHLHTFIFYAYKLQLP